MSALRVDEKNYKEFVNAISEARNGWIKAIEDSAITIMEQQRLLLGMSIKTYYSEFLGCSMNYRTLRDIVNRTKPVPTELMLSFCFTYGYDIKKFTEVSNFLKTGQSMDYYQQIGASIEALGRHGIYQLAEGVSRSCTNADQYNRKRCAELLIAFAKSLEAENESENNKRVEAAGEKIATQADAEIAAIKSEAESSSNTIKTIVFHNSQN